MLSETAQLALAEDAIAALLPEGWRCARGRASPGVDLALVLHAPEGSSVDLVVEVKDRLPPGNVVGVAAQLARSAPAYPIVVAGWLSPLTRASLKAAGIGYLDLTGNAELRLSRPGLVVRTHGAARDPEPASAALGSLRGAGASRAARALVDFAPPYGVRAIAKLSGASAPVLSRVATLLASEGLLQRDEQGQLVDVPWEGVLRRWAADYRFGGAERGVSYLDPRGPLAFVRRLPSLAGAWAATGTLGVPPGIAVAPVTLATVYVPSPERAARELGLVSVERGANVLLVGTSARDELSRAAAGPDGVIRCAPSQVVADLLTGPGRGTAEAEELVEWMRGHESSWRTKA